jgi:hypothetical protein
MNITYHPQTFTITAPDTDTFVIDTVFFSLLRNEPFNEDTIYHAIAQFYTAMKYVPVYIPDRESTYRLVTHLLLSNNQASFVQPDTFHQALIAFLAGKGYVVSTQQ